MSDKKVINPLTHGQIKNDKGEYEVYEKQLVDILTNTPINIQDEVKETKEDVASMKEALRAELKEEMKAELKAELMEELKVPAETPAEAATGEQGGEDAEVATE